MNAINITRTIRTDNHEIDGNGNACLRREVLVECSCPSCGEEAEHHVTISRGVARFGCAWCGAAWKEATDA